MALSEHKKLSYQRGLSLLEEAFQEIGDVVIRDSLAKALVNETYEKLALSLELLVDVEPTSVPLALRTRFKIRGDI